MKYNFEDITETEGELIVNLLALSFRDAWTNKSKCETKTGIRKGSEKRHAMISETYKRLDGILDKITGDKDDE